jgi:hypothetical protein
MMNPGKEASSIETGFALISFLICVFFMIMVLSIQVFHTYLALNNLTTCKSYTILTYHRGGLILEQNIVPQSLAKEVWVSV